MEVTLSGATGTTARRGGAVKVVFDPLVFSLVSGPSGVSAAAGSAYGLTPPPIYTESEGVLEIQLLESDFMLVNHEGDLATFSLLANAEATNSTLAFGTPSRWSPEDPVATLSGTMVTITAAVSQVTVPDLTGMTEQEARDALAAIGLTAGNVTMRSDSAPVGQVIGQNPTAGTQADSGAAVDFVVSTGPGPDSDGDGVPDSLDLCADTPVSSPVDAEGCTVFPQVKILEPEEGAIWCNGEMVVVSGEVLDNDGNPISEESGSFFWTLSSNGVSVGSIPALPSAEFRVENMC